MGAGALCAACRSAHRTRATSRISTRHQHATLSTQHPAPYNFFVSQVSQLSPDLARGVLRLARALLAATKNWALYPPEHPAVEQAVARFADAIREITAAAVFSISITPDTLLVEGASADQSQTAIADAAAYLHDRDILQLTFAGEVPLAALQRLLTILTLDGAERRG